MKAYTEIKEKIFSLIFGYVLLYRFLFPFVYSPMENIFSDPARHWQNGLRFFSGPVFMNGVDAKFYQLFIWAIAQTLSLNAYIIVVLSGLLCSATGYIWYKAARELLPKYPALITAIVISAHPSLLLIYSYFMTETLVIFLMGLGVWFTLRARRKKTLKAFAAALVVWVLAMQTRSAMIPVAIISLFFMFAFLKYNRKKALYLTAALLLLTGIPSAMYTHKQLHIYSPFMVTAPTQLYYYAGTRAYELHILDEGNYGWSSPTLDSYPLRPLSNYTTYRGTSKPPTYTFTFRKADGYAPWAAELAKLKAAYSWEHRFKDILDNIVFFTVGGTWPDANRGNDERAVWMWNYDLRWTWPPLIIAILMLFPFIRLPQQASYIVGLGFVMTLLMYLQETGVMEGRYRKPFEPLFILAMPLLWQALKKPSGEKPWNHVLQLLPLSLGLHPHNTAVGRAPRDRPAPDIRPTAPSTKIATPRKKTAAKKSSAAKKTPKKAPARKRKTPKSSAAAKARPKAK